MMAMAHPSESSRLLVNTASEEDSSPLQRQQRAAISCPPPKHLCLPSKAAILILLWTAIVGALYYIIMGSAAAIEIHVERSRTNSSISIYEPLLYAILAFVMMLYPLSGFIADVCCGRLKTVVISLIILLLCLTISFTGMVIGESTTFTNFHRYDKLPYVFIVIVFLLLFVFIIGLAGYQANFIQLGLDQLFEAPSRYLILFIHYAIWAFQSGSLSFIFILFLTLCSHHGSSRKTLALAATVLFNILMIVLLLIGYLKRKWFHIEPGCQNPYKTVYNIINFAKSHKHPLRRSAFTHNDDYIPSRLDFAKERFGGPFTTEQVENVKTFLRMLVILFAIGPSFALEVPASYYIFPLFGLHLVLPINHHKSYDKYCTHKLAWKFMLGSGATMNLVSIVILFPAYIWIIFHYLHKKVPKLFVRLGTGITLCLLGVVSLLIADVMGHTHALNSYSEATHSLCVFQATISPNRSFTYPALNMHWGVLILPTLLLRIGPMLVIATTLEFISAQSPQSMKGLLVGVFFAIRGLFQFLNSIVIIPLSLNQPWASKEMIEHPPVTNCGFVYLALTSVTGLIGLILFSLAAKRYKYRTRDEGMFRQHDVEEIFDKYITQNQAAPNS